MKQNRKMIELIPLDVRRELIEKSGLRLVRQNNRLLVHCVVAEPVAVGALEVTTCGKLDKDVTKNCVVTRPRKVGHGLSFRVIHGGRDDGSRPLAFRQLGVLQELKK